MANLNVCYWATLNVKSFAYKSIRDKDKVLSFQLASCRRSFLLLSTQNECKGSILNYILYYMQRACTIFVRTCATLTRQTYIRVARTKKSSSNRYQSHTRVNLKKHCFRRKSRTSSPLEFLLVSTISLSERHGRFLPLAPIQQREICCF